MRNVWCIVLLALLGETVWAGTRIESQDGEGVGRRLFIEGKKIRIESDNEQGYILLNLESKKLYAINNAEHQIIDLSELYQAAKPNQVRRAKPEHAIEFVKEGEGPVIVQQATVRYSIKANGQRCSEEYLAPGLLEQADVKTFFEALDHLQQPEEDWDEKLDSADDACDVVDFAVNFPQYATMGVPLRIMDRQGHVEHEIVKIQSGVVFPAFTFDLPSGYRYISFQELQNVIREQVEKAGLPTDAGPGKSKGSGDKTPPGPQPGAPKIQHYVGDVG